MKIGTVGTGFVVADFIESARDVLGMEITAVYSRTAAQADAFAGRHAVVHRFSDRDAFLTSCEFDFVYIASPNSLHFQWAKDALNAGKHVICEKPFVTTTKELRELIELAKGKERFLFEAITVPHLPNYRLLREHLNKIGRIKMVQMNFSQYSSRYTAFLEGKTPNVFNPEYSGGALMDINYYNLYLTAGLFGCPNRIKYCGNITKGIDTSGVLLLEYDGFIATLVGCKDSKSVNMSQIQGEQGFIFIPGESSRCASFQVSANNERNEYNVQSNPRALYYEQVEFKRIFDKKDFAARDQLLNESLLITELVEQVRREAGILFPDDDKRIRAATATGFITPQEPCRLGGYGMRTGKWKGIMHELKCSAIVLTIEGEKVVFCDAEVLSIDANSARKIKERLNENYNISPDLITIAAVHSHSTPLVMGAGAEDDAEDDAVSEAYGEYLEHSIYEIIAQALLKEPVTVEASYKTVNVEGFYGNRIGIGNPEDKDVTIIKFKNGDDLIAAAINLSCHPTVLGAENLNVSGDLLGYLSTLFYESYRVYPVMLQGAAGDMSNRNYRQGHDLEELKRTGKGIAAQIFADDSGYFPLHLKKPVTEHYNYKDEYCLDINEWQRLRAETETKINEEADYDRNKILRSILIGIDQKIANPHVTIDFHAIILRLGDLELCQVPAEMFSHFGKQIKAASRSRLPLIWGYANGYFGYMADETLYGKTYECTMSPLRTGEANLIVDELARLMRGEEN